MNKKQAPWSAAFPAYKPVAYTAKCAVDNMKSTDTIERECWDACMPAVILRKDILE